MKKNITLILVLAFLATSATSESFAQSSLVRFDNSAFTASAQEPDVFGFFFIKGKAPAGLTDIDHLNLGGSGEYGAGANPPYYGQIRLKNKARTDYKLLKPTLNGKKLSFKTEAVAGVSYEFDGTLMRTDFGGESQPAANATVLSGTLRKMKAGKMIAEGKVNFRWELGD